MLTATLRRTIPDLGRKVIAVVSEHVDRLRYTYLLQHLAKGLTNRGVRCVVCDFGSLSIEDGGVFYPEGRIDVVYLMHGPPRPAQPSSGARWVALLQAVYDGRVTAIGDLGQMVLHPKGLLALVSDEEATPEIDPAVRSSVPWTRILEDRFTMHGGQKVDLLSWVGANKDSLILKGSLRSGGRGSVVGRDALKEEWSAKISEIVSSREPWVVQEWIDPGPVELACLRGGSVEFEMRSIDYGIFMFDRAFGGAVRRNTTVIAPRFTHGGLGGGVMPVMFLS